MGGEWGENRMRGGGENRVIGGRRMGDRWERE